MNDGGLPLLTLVYIVPSLSPVSNWWKTMVTESSSWSVIGVMTSFLLREDGAIMETQESELGL